MKTLIEKAQYEPVVMSFLIGTTTNLALALGFDPDPATFTTIATGVYAVTSLIARRFVTPVIKVLNEGGWFDPTITESVPEDHV